MNLKRLWLKTNLIVLLITLASCSPLSKKNNSKEHEDSPYVLLISLDGFRHDYIDLHKAKNLQRFRNQGSYSKSLRPMFPSKTFPNHLSIVTGLRPENHGIVANHFYDPKMKRSYKLKDRSAVEDEKFYSGVPLWSLAEKNNMLSATYFWPGSEAKIAGERPSYWKRYNHSTPHNERIDGVLSWLKLPKNKRPHLLSLYFHDVDSAGHKYGPTAKETYEAVQKVDISIGKLIKRTKEIAPWLNIVIVSDHGMTSISPKKIEYFEKNMSPKELLLFSKFKKIGYGPIAHFYYMGSHKDKANDVNQLSNFFKKNANHYKVFKRNSIPLKYKFQKNERIGDLLAIADNNWTIGLKNKVKASGGNHGYDPYEGMDMHGIFLAKGPSITSGISISTIDNIDIYPFIAKMLGLKYSHHIDGKPQTLAPFIKKQPHF